MELKPRLLVVGLGGTISTLVGDRTDIVDYFETGEKKSAGEILSLLPEAARLADLRAVEMRSVSSSAVAPADWATLAATLEEALAEPDMRGAVVLHGTASMEETAYALHLVLKTDKPVVLTGSQRPANALGSDGPANLLAACRVALSRQASGLGVLVVLNDEIHSARDVAKTSTYRLHAFRSPGAGPLGQVDGDRVYIRRLPARLHTLASAFDRTSLERFPRVDIVYSYAGADGTAIRAFSAAGAKGIVSAGMAPGLPTPAERLALEQAAAAGICVVQSSRAGGGRVIRRRYLEATHIVAADDLNPQKARILLGLALSMTRDPDEIQGFFDTH